MDFELALCGDNKCRLTAPGRGFQDLQGIQFWIESRFDPFRSSLKFRSYMQRVGVVISVISRFKQQAK